MEYIRPESCAEVIYSLFRLTYDWIRFDYDQIFSGVTDRAINFLTILYFCPLCVVTLKLMATCDKGNHDDSD